MWSVVEHSNDSAFEALELQMILVVKLIVW